MTLYTVLTIWLLVNGERLSWVAYKAEPYPRDCWEELHRRAARPKPEGIGVSRFCG